MTRDEQKNRDNAIFAGRAQSFLRSKGFYTGPMDNWAGSGTLTALIDFLGSLGEGIPEPVLQELRGDGTWPWFATVQGNDIVVENARATCFGGSNDPQDSGATASGISTKNNPSLQAVSLPMDYRGPHAPTRKVLQGSPIPIIPWRTMVEVRDRRTGKTIMVPVIDLGPAKYTGNAIDLTVAAARQFDPRATATNFETRVDFRIIDGAKYIS